MLAPFDRLGVPVQAEPHHRQQLGGRPRRAPVPLRRQRLRSDARSTWVVHRSARIGSPRDPGSTSRSSAATIPGSSSVTGLRPAPRPAPARPARPLPPVLPNPARRYRRRPPSRMRSSRSRCARSAVPPNPAAAAAAAHPGTARPQPGHRPAQLQTAPQHPQVIPYHNSKDRISPDQTLLARDPRSSRPCRCARAWRVLSGASVAEPLSACACWCRWSTHADREWPRPRARRAGRRRVPRRRSRAREGCPGAARQVFGEDHQAREYRQHVGEQPREAGRGQDGPALEPSCMPRSQAMADRDQHGERVHRADAAHCCLGRDVAG